MKKILSITLVLFLAFSCIPLAYASDTTPTAIELPALPDLQYAEPYPARFTLDKIIFKVGSQYYACIYETPVERTGQSQTIGLTNNRICFLQYSARYAETYMLSADGKSWELWYETGAENVSGSDGLEVYLSSDINFPADDWVYAWETKALVVYNTRADMYISRNRYAEGSHHYSVSVDDYYDVTFSCTHIDADGDKLCDLCSESVGGSTEDGGNDSWSDEDKGWLGNAFDSVVSAFNTGMGIIESWLKDILNRIIENTKEIGKFIDNAVSSISGFFDKAVSSISGFFDNLTSSITSLFDTLSTWIENARLEIEDALTGIWDSVKDWWLNTVCVFWEEKIQGIKDWWSELWKPVDEWFAEQKAESEAIAEAFTSFFDSIIMLFEAVFDYSYEESGGAVDGNA